MVKWYDNNENTKVALIDNEFCNEYGYNMSDLSFNGYKPILAMVSKNDECPYMAISLRDYTKPSVDELNEQLDYTPHWYIIGCGKSFEIECDWREAIKWLQTK